MVKKIHPEVEIKTRGYSCTGTFFWAYIDHQEGRLTVRFISIPDGSEGVEYLDNIYAKKVPLNEICKIMGIRALEYQCSPPRIDNGSFTNSIITRMVERGVEEINRIDPNTPITRYFLWYEICHKTPYSGG